MSIARPTAEPEHPLAVLQRQIGNRAVTSALENLALPPLMTSGAFQSRTKLSWGRSGKSGAEMDAIAAAIDRVNALGAGVGDGREQLLESLVRLCTAWLSGKGATSSRRQPVIEVVQQAGKQMGAIAQARRGQFVPGTSTGGTDAPQRPLSEAMDLLDRQPPSPTHGGGTGNLSEAMDLLDRQPPSPTHGGGTGTGNLSEAMDLLDQQPPSPTHGGGTGTGNLSDAMDLLDGRESHRPAPAPAPAPAPVPTPAPAPTHGGGTGTGNVSEAMDLLDGRESHRPAPAPVPTPAPAPTHGGGTGTGNVFEAMDLLDRRESHRPAPAPVPTPAPAPTHGGGTGTGNLSEAMGLLGGSTGTELGDAMSVVEEPERAPTTKPPRPTGTFVSGSNTPFVDENTLSSSEGVLSGSFSKLTEVRYDPGQTGGTIRGNVGLFKPEKETEVGALSYATRTGLTGEDPNIIGRNLASFEVAKLLGEDLIAPTWRAMHGGQEGIVMEKIRGHKGRDILDEKGAYALREQYLNDPKVARSLSNLYLLDQICGQVDRHFGNMIIEQDERGKITGVRGIDNNFSFGKDYRDIDMGVENFTDKSFFAKRTLNRGLAASELTGIDRQMAQKIVELAEKNPSQLALAIETFLQPEEVEATLARLQSLAKFLKPKLDSNDPVIKSSWS